MLIFDCETDGLLDKLTKIHCLHLYNTENGRYLGAHDHGAKVPVEKALRMLMEAEDICGHNIMAFDIPALQKVYPWFKPKGRVWDTLVMSRLVYADLRDRDFRFRDKHPDFPGQMIGRHSLESWGMRLGEWKGDYAKVMKERGIDPWAEWNQEMDDYCHQDVVVTRKLYEKLMSKGFSEESLRLEHDVFRIVLRQMQHGVLFDESAANRLIETLMARRAELSTQLQAAFPPWYRPRGVETPKRNLRRKEHAPAGELRVQRTAGCPFTRIERVIFNPGSRDHIANRLTAKYRWKPRQFTKEGRPQVDESILSELKYPEAVLINEYLMVEKRLGQLAEGKEAWLRAVRSARIRGQVNTNGAVTGRMTHSRPNLAQVPAVGAPFGAECRALFRVPDGFRLVGADASGLELRCLAHYMARWDGGDYAKVILEGDIHTVNQTAAGLPTRNNAKTFIYAFLYGAGDRKIGSIIGKGAQAGRALKTKFLRGLPALGKLLEGVQRKTKQGYIRGLDGRLIYIRSEHAALNTLLQGAGAVVMKKALVLLDDYLHGTGYVPGVDYEFVLNIHDEFQIECREAIAEEVGQLAVKSIQDAGKHFGFRCPLDGEAKIGKNWAETH